MKICPTCKQAYSDDTLNFCLSDGTVLVQAAVTDSDSKSAATVVMPMPPPTDPAGQQQTIPSWQHPSVYAQPIPAQKQSTSWKWLVGGIVGVLVLGGAGVFGLVALAVMYGDNTNTTPSNRSTPTYQTPDNDTDVFREEDLSLWRREENSFGKTDYENGEFVMNSKGSDYYYVLVSGDEEFLTSNATTKVTLRNVTGKPTKQGYGLIVHSDPSQALKKDYAFLIDTVKKSYRVVMHTDKKETEVIKWTPFPAIRGGTETNQISVKDEPGKLTLYINDQMATTVKESGDYEEGVAGLYVSDAIPIAFSNLKLSK